MILNLVLVALLLAGTSLAMSLPASECAVVGCGVLGTSLCKQILSSPEFANWKVTGITKTTNRHEDIQKEVGEDSDRFDLKTGEECEGKKFENVVFCAPPSGFEDYPKAVADCAEKLWMGTAEGRGVFVFTSSGAVYEGSGNVVNEDSPVEDVSKNPRAARLINAEKAVLEKGGTCLRLAGLYTITRGAHNFWLTSGKDVSGRADGIINQVHYDDAAGSVLAALAAGPTVVNGNVFLISDGHPMTREEICRSSLQAKLYAGLSVPKFLGSENDPVGKIYDGAASNKALKWDPRYESFDAFMKSNA